MPRDHPLRGTTRPLSRSPHAREIRDRATRELDELLHGDDNQREVLGFVTASGGGLTLDELEEHTGIPRYALEHMLASGFGRTIADRLDHGSPQTHRLWLFTHESLAAIAVERLGATLRGYHDRLHAWADMYRVQGWPPATPQYLLRGYVELLQAQCNGQQLTALAVDPARHRRLLDFTGSDSAALAEIGAAQTLVLNEPEPDLRALLRLSICRDELTQRNSNLPAELPAVWVSADQPVRAVSLARSITDIGRRGAALGAVVVELGAAGHFDIAEQTVGLIGAAALREPALAALAEAAAAAGDLVRAERLARLIAHDGRRWDALVAVARVAVSAAELDRADEAADSSPNADLRARVLAEAALRLACAGALSRAKAVAMAAEAIAAPIADAGVRGEILAAVVTGLAAVQEVDHAEHLAHAITVPSLRAAALTAVIRSAVAAGQVDRARIIAGTITHPNWHNQALSAIAEVLATIDVTAANRVADTFGGDGVRDRVWSALAADNSERAREFARTVAWPARQDRTLLAVAAEMIEAGDPYGAVQVAQTAGRSSLQDQTIVAAAVRLAVTGDLAGANLVMLAVDAQRTQNLTAMVAEALASAGDAIGAERMARTVTDARARTHALIVVARAVARLGHHERAGAILQSVEETARSTVDPDRQARMLATAAKAVAVARNFLWAERIARRAESPKLRDLGLTMVADEMARAGAVEDAVRLAHRSEADTQHKIMATVSEALAAAGHPGRAMLVARRINDRGTRMRTWASVAVRTAARGDFELATQAAREILDQKVMRWALNEVDKVRFRARTPIRNLRIARLDVQPTDAARLVRSVVNPARDAEDFVGIAEVANPAQAVPYLAAALAVGPWWTPLPRLAQIRPDVVLDILAEHLAVDLGFPTVAALPERDRLGQGLDDGRDRPEDNAVAVGRERRRDDQLHDRGVNGDGYAADRLADMLVEQGRIEEALNVLRDLAATGDKYAALRLADVLAEQGRIEEAQNVLRDRAATGDRFAADRLADMLAQQGRIDELHDLAATGDGYAAGRLADMLVEQGRIEEALNVLHDLAATGDGYAAGRLADMLVEQGRIEEALQVVRNRAAAGDGHATGRLADMLVEQGRIEEALNVLRDLAATGDGYAALRLADILAELGRIDELGDKVATGTIYAAERRRRRLESELDQPGSPSW
ncbi:hypothetical protein AB0M46_18620 [Dactylosporangium sp. NPDC051485]|uniref:tetratricopeptide repeat protein n=1 Tax=Dactylosporangium sp. NPDC051485 TaxID=3154846 RepID=UPI003425A35B